eukprot:1159927-Pelagomonas_calceolata.AAC.4
MLRKRKVLEGQSWLSSSLKGSLISKLEPTEVCLFNAMLTKAKRELTRHSLLGPKGACWVVSHGAQNESRNQTLSTGKCFAVNGMRGCSNLKLCLLTPLLVQSCKLHLQKVTLDSCLKRLSCCKARANSATLCVLPTQPQPLLTTA